MAKLENNWTSGKLTPQDIELVAIKPENYDNEEPEKKLPSASQMGKNFVDATSLHGIRYVFWRRPLWARLGWLVILLAFTAYFLFTAHNSLTKYYSWPINTVITQKYEDKLDFPAVTICPLNLVSKKKMYALDGDANSGRYGLNDSVCSTTAAVRDGKACGAAMMCCCLNIVLLDAGRIVPNCTLQYAGELIAAQQSSGIFFDAGQYYKKYAQGVDEMLGPGMCVFDADFVNLCGVSDFKTTVTDFGICYTFNSDPDNIKKAQLEGAGGGLNILLDAQVEDQTIGRMSEGFTVIIHRQGDFFTPFEGINVAPGQQASIILHQQRIINLEAPYETKCENRKLKTQRSYTKSGCVYECSVEAIMKKCKCYTAQYSGATTMRGCGKVDQLCILEATAHLEPSKCGCPVPCNETRYTTEVYYSSFPDAGTATVIQAEYAANVPFEYMRENFVLLQIGYKTLSYELQEQKVAFGRDALFGEIGGNMGLFLGCSLMTVFEFADLLVALIYVRKLHKEYQT